MAYTKKNTSTATSSRKDTVNKIDEFNKEEVKETYKEVVEKEPRKFAPGDMIPCRCVRPNKVIFYSSKTDTRYEFGGYGDINEVDYSDLLRFKSSKSPILFQPKILIEDEDLRKLWNLNELVSEYDGIYETEKLFDKTPDEFERYLRNASPSIKELVKISASNLINEEKLTDLRIIRIVDDVLGTKYKEFI